MTERFKTLGQTTLAEDLTSGETAIDVTSAAALRDSFTAGDTYRIRIDNEIYKVTGEAGNTLTAVPGQEGTAEATHTNGATVYAFLTSAALTQLKLDANLAGITGNSGGPTILSADYTLAGADGVFADTGLQVTLPAAGLYLLIPKIEAYTIFTVGTTVYALARLYNSTDAEVVGPPQNIFAYSEVVSKGNVDSATWPVFVTALGATVIKMQAAKGFDGTAAGTVRGTTSAIGNTSIAWIKIKD